MYQSQCDEDCQDKTIQLKESICKEIRDLKVKEANPLDYYYYNKPANDTDLRGDRLQIMTMSRNGNTVTQSLP